MGGAMKARRLHSGFGGENDISGGATMPLAHAQGSGERMTVVDGARLGPYGPRTGV